MDFLSLVAKLSLDSSEYESGLSKAKGLVSSVGGGIASGLKLAGAAIGAATAAVVGFGAASVSTGKEFDKSMSQVAATMGLSMDEMTSQIGRVDTQWGQFSGNLRDYARFMGANTAFSAKEAADALNYMALAGYDAQTSMAMLPNVLNLAAAGDMDLARASDMVTDTQTAFGISLERTSQMVDEMAKAASTGNTSVGQLGDAFLVVGGLAQELNGGFVQTANGANIAVDGVQELEIALTAMANAGVKGGEAGTHMRNMLLKLSDPTDDGVAALESMGVAIFDVEGNMRSLTDIMGDLQMSLGTLSQEDKIGVISSLFNTRDMAAAEALLGAVEQKYVKIGDDLVDMATAYEQYGDAIYDSTQGFEIVQSSWDSIGESILNAQLPLEDAVAGISKYSEAWQKYGIESEAQIEKLAGDIRYDLTTANMDANEAVMDIAQAYNMSFKDAQDAVYGVRDALRETQGAASEMADTQLDNLAGDITKFQSALSDAKIEVSDQLTPSLRQFVQFGTSGLSDLTSAFKTGGLSGAMSKFGDILSEGLGMVVEVLPDAVDAGLQLIGALADGIIENAPVVFDAITEIGSMLGEKLLGLMENLAEFTANVDWATYVQNIIDTIVNFFTSGGVQKFLGLGLEIIANIGNGLIQSVPVLVSNAKTLMENLGAGLKEGIPKLLPIALNAIMEFSGSLRENVGSLVDSGLDMILAIADGLIQSLPAMIKTIPTIVSNIAGIINDNAPKLIMTGVQLIGKLLSGIVQAIPTIIAEFPKIVKAIFDVMMAVNWINLGGTIIKGIVNGVKNLASSLPTALKNIGKQGLEWLKAINWKTLGKDIIDLIVIGVKGLANAIPNALKTIGTTAINVVKKIDWVSLGKAIISTIVTGLKNFGSMIGDTIKGLAEEAWEKVKNIFGGKSKESAENAANSPTTVGAALPYIPSLERREMSEYTEPTLEETPSENNNNADKYFEEEQKLSRLAKAIVDAFIDADIGVEIDDKEFGRLVRKAVTA